MKVKDILNAAADLIQSSSLFEELSNENMLNSRVSDSSILINCLNVVLNDISTNYFEIKKTFQNSTTSKILLKNILGKYDLKEIISVKDMTGVETNYKISDGYILTEKAGFTMEYTVFPLNVSSFDDEVSYWDNISLKSFVIAQGVVSEFYLIKGCFEESQIWERKFRQTMHNIVTSKKEIVMPARRWC